MLAVMGGAFVVLTMTPHLSGEFGIAIALMTFCIGASIAAAGMHRFYHHEQFGMCNLITTGRLALTSALAGMTASPPELLSVHMWLAVGVAVVALALDGVDGWSARRAGLVSPFGARFDIEVDSFFALVLALLAYRTGQAGPWIIALGLPRYLFVMAGFIWPQLTVGLPASFSRKAVCVFQIGVLVSVLVPVLPSSVITFSAALAAIALAWSFLRDLRWLIAAGR
ncbi:CDP-alcohol phosphatidyltransferase family protein [Tropicimonas aquimaris]|uniref:CDP-alcohol phosphatidyltransferase family protein n=1 Tax=Tropicimonas aquimaris TaxID=914152 RepID=A0ABW3IU01_9RHOB